MRGLVWFREDLRTIDNTALYYAALRCKDGIAAVYIIDTNLWMQHDTAACRIEFTLRGLTALHEELQKLNIPFMILDIANTADTASELLKLIDHLKADALYFNCQYEVNEQKRDAIVKNSLLKNRIQVYSFDDQVILPPGSIKTQLGNHFSVFTPYKRAWYKEFSEQEIKQFPAPKKQFTLDMAVPSSTIPTSLSNFKSEITPQEWPAGQQIAKKRLQKFIDKRLLHYDKERDFPSREGTSKLSPYLASGMISPRQCFLAALDFNQNELYTGNKGAIAWMGELIWREFYKHILVTVPRISKNKAYKEETEYLPWQFDEKSWRAWQTGQTGYPLIDAAMRQLNTTGWMHNRLRMIVAMFLTKNLFFDWRLGEKYFMSRLIDGDLAANNGGWQWCASTGTDSAPYFRIFNPIRQSERFDPDGKFILQYCPELRDFDKKSIHAPYSNLPLIAAQSGYPHPIIDLNKNRDKVLSAFKTIKTKAS
ncbi:MAG: deoxyribodipyrimidine photo-lyase [Gammaproteobacteria bacterium]